MIKKYMDCYRIVHVHHGFAAISIGTELVEHLLESAAVFSREETGVFPHGCPMPRWAPMNSARGKGPLKRKTGRCGDLVGFPEF